MMVRPVLDLAELTRAHAAIVAGHSDIFRCSSNDAVKYPDIGWLDEQMRRQPPTHEILVAVDDSYVFGLAVVHLADSRIVWLNVNTNQAVYSYAEVFTALSEAIKERYGEAWGQVHNPAIHEVLTAADPRYVVERDNTVRLTD